MERTYQSLGAGIDWDDQSMESDPVAEALEAVAAALASVGRPAPPAPRPFPQQFADPREMSAAAAAGLEGRSNPTPQAAAFVVDRATPDLTDPTRAAWVAKVRVGLSALVTTRTNLARHVEALSEFAKVVARPPASVAPGEYEPIATALERYVLNTKVAVDAEVARQRVIGPD